MKKLVFSFLLNILVISFVISIFKGINLPTDSIYALVVYCALSIGIMLHKPVLKFLTVKINILTFWLAASIISLGVFYLLVTFLPGLEISESVIKQMNFGAVTIESFKLDMMLTMISSVLMSSFIAAVMETLKKPTED